jgi:hypothetical protein
MTPAMWAELIAGITAAAEAVATKIGQSLAFTVEQVAALTPVIEAALVRLGVSGALAGPIAAGSAMAGASLIGSLMIATILDEAIEAVEGLTGAVEDKEVPGPDPAVPEAIDGVKDTIEDALKDGAVSVLKQIRDALGNPDAEGTQPPASSLRAFAKVLSENSEGWYLTNPATEVKVSIAQLMADIVVERNEKQSAVVFVK